MTICISTIALQWVKLFVHTAAALMWSEHQLNFWFVQSVYQEITIAYLKISWNIHGMVGSQIEITLYDFINFLVRFVF